MAKYRVTNKAVDDLSRIWNYTFDKWSETQADKYYGMLIKNCDEVATNPDLGKTYSSIADHLMGFKTGRHIIFYQKVEGGVVEIIRILHEHMDLKNRLKEK